MRRYRTYDKLSVVYRPSPDSTWTKLVDLKPPSTTSWKWDTLQYDLPEKALTAHSQVGFYYDNSNQFAWGAAIDDIELFLNTTSARMTDNSVSMVVYPNPSQGRFNVELSTGLPGSLKLQVVNITGQTVFEKFIDNRSGKLSEMIDLSTQPKGVYQLTIRSEKAEWKQKITVQ
jgi:hypothetical protein